MKTRQIDKIYFIFFVLLLFVASAFVLSCSEETYTEKTELTVTLLNGEHYTVVGDNKKSIGDDKDISFTVEIERGHKIVDSYNTECIISDDLAFRQTVTFENVRYKIVTYLITEEMPVSTFEIYKDDEAGSVFVETVLGAAGDHTFYNDDIMCVTAEPKEGYRFWCWSEDDYFSNGGSFYSYDSKLPEFPFLHKKKLFANFKNTSNTQNTVIYDMGNGIELEQDCAAMIAAHPRANTLTAKNLYDKEGFVGNYDFDENERMLVGWETTDGVYVGLGSRVAVDSTKYIKLYPVWKSYNSVDDFEFEEVSGGGLLLKKYIGQVQDEEIVIPNKARLSEFDEKKNITAIGALAFEECSASKYYLPSTLCSVENNAFIDCKSLREIYMSDNIMNIDDGAFAGCVNFETLHINAFLEPRYVSYKEAVKTDIFDLLAFNIDSPNPNMVILGGSSVSHGYDNAIIKQEFEIAGLSAPNVYNFGWNATLCSVSQFEMALPYLRKNDILLHAPEHYMGSWGGNSVESEINGGKAILLEGMFYECVIAESNWALISGLTINKYANFFATLREFNETRAHLSPQHYSGMWYNNEVYGLNKDGEEIHPECNEDKIFWNSGCNINPDYEEVMQRAKENIYVKAVEKGVKVFVTFAPVCKQDVLIKYESEDKMRQAAAEYTRKILRLTEESQDIKVLLKQSDTVYDSRHFYNHPYHLGSPFREIHTENVINAMLSTMVVKNIL